VTHENDSKALAGFGVPRDLEEEGPVRTGLTAGRLVRGVLRAAFALLALWVGAIVLLALAYTVLPPVSTLMLARTLTGRSVERSVVGLDAVAPALPAAVIASEDARFCQHAGVDWGALREVVEDAEEGGPTRGASTIPMQVAKNLFLWPSRSYIRKGLELPLALWIDLAWSKRRMMEIYLNVAEWGEGIFGARPRRRPTSASPPRTSPGARPRSSPRRSRTPCAATPPARAQGCAASRTGSWDRSTPPDR
jgi:monofunctional biosynthetic peptidoglycan transglycosylase